MGHSSAWPQRRRGRAPLFALKRLNETFAICGRNKQRGEKPVCVSLKAKECKSLLRARLVWVTSVQFCSFKFNVLRQEMRRMHQARQHLLGQALKSAFVFRFFILFFSWYTCPVLCKLISIRCLEEKMKMCGCFF